MARRGQKIDDKLREEIRAYFASCGNKKETARKFGVSDSTVRKVVSESDEFAELRAQKKREHIEKAWAIINTYMDRVLDPEVVERTNARDSAIVMGTLWDKINKEKELGLKQEELTLRRLELEKAEETDNGELGQIAEALKRAVKND